MSKINICTFLLAFALLFTLASCSQPEQKEVPKEPTPVKEEKKHEHTHEYVVKGKLVETEDVDTFSSAMSSLQADGHITYRTVTSSTLFEYHVEFAGDASKLSQLIQEHADLSLVIDISGNVLQVSEEEIDDD